MESLTDVPGMKVNGALNIQELRSRVRGQVIVPGDLDYDQGRKVADHLVNRRPAVIVRPVDAGDVAEVIRLAGQTGLELSIRSGGHSAAGYGVTEGGIMLDLRDMRGLQIDPENRTAWVEAGVSAGEYTRAADAYGLATGFGDTASVGISGITLGGGIGYLVRKHGLTIDHLLAVEIVTASGEILLIDEDNHPDLFWAIRGGGGNFGVVTRLKFCLHPVDPFVGGMIFLPATPETIVGFIAAAQSAPDELSTIANIMPAPPMPFIPADLYGKMILMGLLAYVGPVEAGLQAIEPFRKLAPPLVDMLRPMRYVEMYPPEQGEGPVAAPFTMFLDHVDHKVAQTILETLQAPGVGMAVASLRVQGGAAGRVPVEATAYPHRQKKIMATLMAFLHQEEERTTRHAWLADFAAALDQGDSSAYVNFLADEGPERVRAAYPGATWDRLREIKTRYDPGNLFRLNQNVPPLVGGNGKEGS